MKLIVGLGNPGAEYAGTRHNAGFEAIDILAARHHIAVAKRSFRSVIGEGIMGMHRVILARPSTFMNLSGEATAEIMRFYKLNTSEIIVISDDVSLPTGRLRLRYKGSAGGHNGLANIIAHLNTQEFARVRIGVGAARPGDLIGHVLSRFRKEEITLIQEGYERAADAVEVALSDGFENAMNRFNLTDKPEKTAEPAVQ